MRYSCIWHLRVSTSYLSEMSGEPDNKKWRARRHHPKKAASRGVSVHTVPGLYQHCTSNLRSDRCTGRCLSVAPLTPVRVSKWNCHVQT